ncbi:hypothetical protein B0H13DRAFT_2345662 [Mycena leptocephala]|nr:hypothetical protein B0H13DRAFT_2345662 [Mycena leptocephala]
MQRKLISEGTDNKYWGAVDKKLGAVRKSYPDAKSQSKWIKKRMLDPDLLLYKHADLTKLAATASVPAVSVAGPSTLPPTDDTPLDDE